MSLSNTQWEDHGWFSKVSPLCRGSDRTSTRFHTQNSKSQDISTTHVKSQVPVCVSVRQKGDDCVMILEETGVKQQTEALKSHLLQLKACSHHVWHISRKRWPPSCPCAAEIHQHYPETSFSAAVHFVFKSAHNHPNPDWRCERE